MIKCVMKPSCGNSMDRIIFMIQACKTSMEEARDCYLLNQCRGTIRRIIRSRWNWSSWPRCLSGAFQEGQVGFIWYCATLTSALGERGQRTTSACNLENT